MTRKHYEAAALIAQAHYDDDADGAVHGGIVSAFIALFADDNPRFDTVRFRTACQPGANVKARG